MSKFYENRKNVVPIHPQKTRFRFVTYTVWIDWFSDQNGKEVKKQFASIALRDDLTGREIIHPVSDFILSRWKLRSYNTQRKHANNIVVFLNNLLSESSNKGLTSLSKLKLSHGNAFLNQFVNLDRSKETIKDYERTLTYFYKFLSDNGCLEYISSSIFIKKHNLQGGYYYESPFTILYPTRKTSKVEHAFPDKYVPLLFEIAILVSQPIVLGLYLQFFGGLRIGEVVNLKRSSLKRKVADGDILVQIKERYFRTDLKDSSGGNYVKKPRNQRIYQIYDWFDHLYHDHLEMYPDVDGSGALFLNRDGRPMSEKSYRQYFEKIKKHFLNYLRETGDIEDKILANHLSIMKWSTHIGRGTFSNWLAEHAENPYEIAQPRGDSGLTSSLSYISKTARMRKKIETSFQDMHGKYIPRLVKRRNKDDGIE
ncbi:hypothetical protein ACQKK5_11115 [Brevibacillus panacihumi]|uniref:hypothetical protein n=1 Tax=Brevibacillus panacihumi TaxID=497735 RepID=UPI003D092162